MAFQAYAMGRMSKSRILRILQIAGLCVLALPLLHMLAGWRMTRRGGVQQEQYHGLVFVSHHKTGTFLVGTIAAGIARFLDVYCLHSIVTVYVNENLTAPAMGEQGKARRALAIYALAATSHGVGWAKVL